MKFIYNYFKTIFLAFRSLASGMRLTLYYFTHPKEIITEQYPENRATIAIPERFRGEVHLIHDESDNTHRCTACTLCQLSCPNGTITIEFSNDENAEGKKEKKLTRWVYDLGKCTFCNQCIEACPTDAIIMKNTFEQSTYDRSKLIKILNKPDSKLKKQPKLI